MTLCCVGCVAMPFVHERAASTVLEENLLGSGNTIQPSIFTEQWRHASIMEFWRSRWRRLFELLIEPLNTEMGLVLAYHIA